MKKISIYIIAILYIVLLITVLAVKALAETRDTIADLNSGTMRLIDLNNRSDLNKDGVIDLQDLAVWSSDYSESQSIRKEQKLKLHPPKPEPNVSEQRVYGADFNDPCFVKFYMEMVL